MAATIYYVGEFKFPEGEAASYRVLGNVKALRAGGLRVVAVGQIDRASTATARADAAKSEAVMPYHLVDEYGPRSAPRWQRAWRYALGGRRLVSWLKAHAAADAQALILAGGYSRYLLRLIPLTRQWGIPLITDVVEWFEPEHCLGGRFGPQRWDVELTLRALAPRAGNVIAISSFLERYFVTCGTSVLRVPPLIDASDGQWEAGLRDLSQSRLRLAFVGNAGQKDLLVNAIRGLALLGPQACACELRMAGPSKEELRTNLGKDSGLLEVLAESLHFAGRLPHREALLHLDQADFSILLRPNLRFAHAGFPTKLVESMAMGVPVICNLTSDISLYVQDGQEGLVVKDCSPESFAEGLRRALALSQEQRMLMRANARRRAQVSFDYRNWVEPMGGFMRQVMENSQKGRR